jgi:hypothetical protein
MKRKCGREQWQKPLHAQHVVGNVVLLEVRVQQRKQLLDEVLQLERH